LGWWLADMLVCERQPWTLSLALSRIPAIMLYNDVERWAVTVQHEWSIMPSHPFKVGENMWEGLVLPYKVWVDQCELATDFWMLTWYIWGTSKVSCLCPGCGVCRGMLQVKYGVHG
jgi:hypothetical protein